MSYLFGRSLVVLSYLFFLFKRCFQNYYKNHLSPHVIAYLTSLVESSVYKLLSEFFIQTILESVTSHGVFLAKMSQMFDVLP